MIYDKCFQRHKIFLKHKNDNESYCTYFLNDLCIFFNDIVTTP